MLLLILLCIAIILFVCLLISIHHRITRASLSVSEALAHINIALEKRYELIPNIIKIAKKHNLCELSTIEELTKLRQQALDASSFEEIVETNALLATQLSTLLTIANASPKLKTDAYVNDLEDALHKIEEELSHAQTQHNDYVNKYNRLVTIFPNAIIAHFMGAKKRKFFE